MSVRVQVPPRVPFKQIQRRGHDVTGKGGQFKFMVDVAQLVRALGCGPRGYGFETHHSPTGC